MSWLAILSVVGIVAPLFPKVRWPVAAHLVPKINDIAASLYTAAWALGAVQGATAGFILGIVVGACATTFIIGVSYWAFFKKARS